VGPFDIIYSDCPWFYRGRKQFGFAGDVGVDTGGAIDQYETMKIEEICALPVKQIVAPDALLFLWVTGPMVPDAMKVIEAWTFKYATIGFVWEKRRTNPGYYTLSECEVCLVAKRGRIPKPRGSRTERQFVSELRGKHSAKPGVVRQRISNMFPSQRKIELFSRDRVAGWTSWGRDVSPGYKHGT
jgi:N6-adenosine-specific RNA methylase IME4